MRRSGTSALVQIVVVICCGMTLSASGALSQSSSGGSANAFDDFFRRLATEPGVGGSRGEASYIKLMDSVGTMAPAEIATGILVIDQQIDSTAEPEDRLAKADAANLLMLISWRQDGTELLASQMNRLTSMLNDSSHLLSGSATLTLQSIGDRRPDLVIPILEGALAHPEVNNVTGVGPGVAVTLLRMSSANNQAVDHIVQYMRRPDLTDTQLARLIVGIDSRRSIPDALTAEFVRCLDRPDENVRSQALVGIARSSPPAREAARPRVQKMANDPHEIAHIRRLATEALRGQITENPESSK